MYVSEKLDREKVNSYHLVITAKDGGNKVRYPAKSINLSQRERQRGSNLVDSWEVLCFFFSEPTIGKCNNVPLGLNKFHFARLRNWALLKAYGGKGVFIASTIGVFVVPSSVPTPVV